MEIRVARQQFQGRKGVGAGKPEADVYTLKSPHLGEVMGNEEVKRDKEIRRMTVEVKSAGRSVV